MFKCFKSQFNCYDFIRNFQATFPETYKNDDFSYTKVVVHPSHYDDQTHTQFWAVEEVHHDYVELLGDFTDIAYACQFADCYTSQDYAWYGLNDIGNIPWED